MATNTADLPPLTWWSTMRWDVVSRALPSAPGTAVIEMGCGMGAFGARLAERYDSYRGVEPAPESAEVARGRIEPHGGTVVDSADALDPAAPADLLCAFEVLEHIEDDVDALRGWTRYLRPGGIVLVSVPGEPDRFGPWDAKVGHYRRYSGETLGALFEAAGLRTLATPSYGFPFGYALETARNLLARRDEAQLRDVPMDQRTESSGRQRQAVSPVAGQVRHVASRPFAAWQRQVPGRGPGLIGIATLPA